MRNNKVFWITGLSGAGKTTVSLKLKEELIKAGINPIHIDGDSIREILGDKFGYSDQERLYLAQCYGRLCKNLSEQNQTVICSTISMYDSVRKWNRDNIFNYIEVYLKAPISTLVSRDPKGLYADVNLRKEQPLVGHEDASFEEPKNPDLIFNACKSQSPSLIVAEILKLV